jgi:hypothetical protein
MRTPVLIVATLFASSLFAAGHDLTTLPPTANQLQAVVTANGSGFTAAWTEQSLSRNAVVASVLNANGEPIEGGVASSDAPLVSSVGIAHSPSGTLIVWTTEDKLIAERLSPSGTSLSTTLVTFGNGYVSNVAVAWNGSRYFVTWTNGVWIAGAFVAPDGSSTAPHIFFSEPVVSGQLQKELLLALDLAWDGQHFIVVFGEVLNALCLVTCPAPIPDQFRVMRVSADGDAIDSSPLIITGSHLRARVASSGSESLIVLDGYRDVSTTVVHTDGGITLGAETPVFSWVSDTSSAVVWDGATFTVGWTYRGADANRIGTARVTRSGLPIDYRFTAAAAFPSEFWGWPTMAVNEAGDAAFVVSEGTAQPSPFVRARLYLASEFVPMPPPPPAPRNVVGYFGGTTARIDWESDPASGFAIEVWLAYNNTWSLYRTVSGDARTTTIYASIGTLVRIRAFGQGGLSEGTVTSIGSVQRRRAAATTH